MNTNKNKKGISIHKQLAKDISMEQRNFEEGNKVPEFTDLNNSDIFSHDRQSRRFVKLESQLLFAREFLCIEK